jgi:hypothetical protein
MSCTENEPSSKLITNKNNSNNSDAMIEINSVLKKEAIESNETLSDNQEANNEKGCTITEATTTASFITDQSVSGSEQVDIVKQEILNAKSEVIDASYNEEEKENKVLPKKDADSTAFNPAGHEEIIDGFSFLAFDLESDLKVRKKKPLFVIFLFIFFIIFLNK